MDCDTLLDLPWDATTWDAAADPHPTPENPARTPVDPPRTAISLSQETDEDLAFVVGDSELTMAQLLLAHWACTAEQFVLSGDVLKFLQVLSEWNVAGGHVRSRKLLLAIARNRKDAREVFISALREKMQQERDFFPVLDKIVRQINRNARQARAIRLHLAENEQQTPFNINDLGPAVKMTPDSFRRVRLWAIESTVNELRAALAKMKEYNRRCLLATLHVIENISEDKDPMTSEDADDLRERSEHMADPDWKAAMRDTADARIAEDEELYKLLSTNIEEADPAESNAGSNIEEADPAESNAKRQRLQKDPGSPVKQSSSEKRPLRTSTNLPRKIEEADEDNAAAQLVSLSLDRGSAIQTHPAC